MKKGIKYLVLSLTLIFPVLIYLFLEGFAVNKYTIPQFYQDQSESRDIPGCLQFAIPHVADLSLYTFEKPEVGQIRVVNPVFDECFDCPPNLNEVKRVSQRHGDVLVHNIYSEMITRIDSAKTESGSNWLITQMGFPDLVNIVKCELIIEVPFDTSVGWLRENGQLVLLDKQNRIRGYYRKADREEIDRLITEIAILKQEADGE